MPSNSLLLSFPFDLLVILVELRSIVGFLVALEELFPAVFSPIFTDFDGPFFLSLLVDFFGECAFLEAFFGTTLPFTSSSLSEPFDAPPPTALVSRVIGAFCCPTLGNFRAGLGLAPVGLPGTFTMISLDDLSVSKFDSKSGNGISILRLMIG